MSGKLCGKTALVTGASRGIGAGIVHRLAADGAAVAFTYSSSPGRAKELVDAVIAAGGKAVAITADATDPAAIKRGVAEASESLGGLDILVNNAGTAIMAEIGAYGDDAFEKILSINVRSAFYTVREAVAHLRDGGRIIFIGSVNSDSMPFAGGSVYALTKGAIASFTRGLARDLGPRRITVNNIQPGPINTEMNPADGPASETLKGLMALKRYGSTEEIAGLVSYLASDEAAFITGAGIKIDGGFDA